MNIINRLEILENNKNELLENNKNKIEILTDRIKFLEDIIENKLGFYIPKNL